MPDFQPDIAQAQRFLSTLDPGASCRSLIEGIDDGFTFQTFDDNKDRKSKALVRVLHGTLGAVHSTLREMNKQGAGVFVTINATDMTGRRINNLTHVRAVWVEDDSGLDIPLPLEPHLISETSPGKYHKLFLVDGLTFDQHQEVQDVLINEYGSDPNAKDLARVLRVPGYYHNKGTPHMVRLIHESGQPPYTAAQILEAFKPTPGAVSVHPAKPSRTLTAPPAPVAEDGYQPITEADALPPLPDIDLSNAAQFLPPPGEQGYSEWRDVGMALHHQFGGSHEALVLFDEWSQQVREYQGFDDVANTWASFGKRSSGPITTFRSLVQAYNKRIAKTKATADVSAVDKAKRLLEECNDYMLLVRDVAPRLWKLAAKNVVLEKDFTQALILRYSELRPGDNLSRADAIRALKMQHRQDREPVEGGLAFDNPKTPDWARDWVWVAEDEVFLDTVSRVRLTSTGFNGQFNGFLPTGDNAPTNAANYLRDNFLIPKVMRSLYAPAFGRLFSYEGASYVNTYNDIFRSAVPDEPANTEAVGLFKKHLESFCGGWNRESQLLANYLAAVTASPPQKVRWAPLLIGAPGDGKSVFADFARAALGVSNTKVINNSTIIASAMSGQTGWAEGHCLGVIEEIKLHGHNKHDVMNAMKPYISNDVVPCKAMHQESRNILNAANYMMFSNYRDAAPVEEGDRRLFILHSQVKLGSLPASYFDDLQNAARLFSGDIVSWLRSVPLHADFKPNGHAPMTDAKREAMRLTSDEMVDQVRELLEDSKEVLYRMDVVCFAALFQRIQVMSNGVVKNDHDFRLAKILTALGFNKLERVRVHGERHRLWGRREDGVTPTTEWAKAVLEARMTKTADDGLGMVEDLV